MRKKPAALVLGCMFALALLAAGIGAHARMTSTNFVIDDEILNFGGGLTTSTSYSVEGDIGDLNIGGSMPEPAVPGSGGVPSASPPSAPVASSTPESADRSPPVISGITVTERLNTSARIAWQTSEPATSVIAYGLTPSYEIGSISDLSLVADHQMRLTGLAPSTTYYFQVRSTDAAGNEARSSQQTFETRASDDVIPPVIEQVIIENITDHTARVTWTTDEATTGIAEYGTTEGYELGAVADPELRTVHHADLSDLTAETRYHVRAQATDANGNRTFFHDVAFVTLPDDTPPANVRSLRAIPAVSSVLLRWINPPDPDAAGVVVVRRFDRFPDGPADGAAIFSGFAEQFNDTGLASDTDHFYTVFAFDVAGNRSSGALASARTGQTPAPPPEQPLAPAVPLPPGAAPEGGGLEPLAGVRFLLASRTLPGELSDGRLFVLPGSVVTVLVPGATLPRPVESIVLNIGSFSYRLAFNGEQNQFEADVSAPAAPGSTAGALIFTYEDGSREASGFALETVSFGFVSEERDGQSVPVSGVTVTLLDASSGLLQPWNGSRYRMNNPLATSVGGAFGFLVPPGTYALRFEKPGYLSQQTGRFSSLGNVVALPARLIAVPLSPLAVIEPELPPAENVVRVLEAIGEGLQFSFRATPRLLRRAVDNPTVEKTAQNVAAPASAAIGVGLGVASAASAAPLLSFWTLLRGLVTQPFLVLARRRRKRWGMVYHALLKLPIDLAIVRLVEVESKRVAQSQVTDAEGRFAFIVPVGRYAIEVTKPGFAFPTELLKEKKADLDFADLYHGEAIEATVPGTVLTPSVPLDPIEKMETPRTVIRRAVFRSLQYAVSAFAVVVSAVSFAVTPSAITGAFLVFQIVLFEFFRRIARGRKPKGWGIVYDAATRKPLRYAFARIFDTQFNKLLDTRVTDASGRYAFLVGRNRFRVVFERSGYQTHELDVDATAENKKIITEKIGLTPGTPAPTPASLPPTEPIPPPPAAPLPPRAPQAPPA